MPYGLLYIFFLNIIYLVGFFFASIALKMTESHYFLGFNPCLFSFNVKGTKFSIGLYIPIVGLSKVYVVVNGEKQQAKYPWEFFDQSIFRRILVTMSGAVTLLISGLLIFIGLNYFVKESIISKEEVNRHGIYPSSWAKQLGFQRGDKIVAVNGKDYEQFFDLIDPDVLQPGSYYTILRDGKELNIEVKEPDASPERNKLFISLLVPFEVRTVTQGSPAEEAGIVPGDRIIKVNGHPILKYHEMTDEFAQDDDGNVVLEVQRKEGDSLKITQINITLTAERGIGIFPKEFITYTEKQNTVGEAISKGISSAFTSLLNNVRAVIDVMDGRVSHSENLRGTSRINTVWETIFWNVTGLYAMLFTLWNLLPLPKSAFWEMIALGYEGVTRKEYSYAMFTRTLKLAWIPVIAFMVWTFVNDFTKLL